MLEKIINTVPNEPVEEVIIGVFSTLVKTVHGCGIASTIKYGIYHDRVESSGQLEQSNLQQLAQLSLSDNLLAASVGIAAINSTFSVNDPRYHKINGTELILEKGAGKTLGIIGHFPFLERISDQFKQVYIFEKFPQPGDLEEKDIPEYLPKADVVAITGTSVTNHTFSQIMQSVSPDSFKIMLGPSTPMSPLFFKTGLDALAGSVVVDYETLKKQVLQATPTRYLDGLQQVCLLRKDFQ